MDGKISEQRVYCADLQKVYGNDALKYATVCKWVGRFNDGRDSIENDPRVGRPVSVLMDKNVATVKMLIEEDACYTVQEIEELSGIHSSSVLKILRERLGLRDICSRWVPHLLTDEQKQSRIRLASQVIEKYDKCDPRRLEEIVIEKYDKCDPRRLEEIVTGDETWIYHFQPDSKAQLVDFYQKRRPLTGVRGIKLLHDNAPAHKSAMVQEYLKESGLNVLDHSSYSPDLSPCDFSQDCCSQD